MRKWEKRHAYVFIMSVDRRQCVCHWAPAHNIENISDHSVLYTQNWTHAEFVEAFKKLCRDQYSLKILPPVPFLSNSANKGAIAGIWMLPRCILFSYLLNKLNLKLFLFFKKNAQGALCQRAKAVRLPSQKSKCSVASSVLSKSFYLEKTGKNLQLFFF